MSESGNALDVQPPSSLRELRRAPEENAEPTGFVVLGEFVKAMRRAKGWSQPQLAQIAGVSRLTISNVETAMRAPKPETLRRIGLALLEPVAPWDTRRLSALAPSSSASTPYASDEEPMAAMSDGFVLVERKIVTTETWRGTFEDGDGDPA